MTCFKHRRTKSHKTQTGLKAGTCIQLLLSALTRTASLARLQVSSVTSTSQRGFTASTRVPLSPQREGLFWGLLLEPWGGTVLSPERSHGTVRKTSNEQGAII